MKTKLVNRIIVYLAGLFILAMGVAMAINADLGTSPVSSVARSIHLALQTHGITAITFGTCTILVYCVFVVLQMVLLRRDFKPVQLLQLLVSTIFGFFADLARAILGNFRIPTYAGSLVMLAISIVLIAVGISLYLGAKLLSMPSEGIGLAITQRLGRHPYHRVKVVIDCVLVASSMLIMLLFTGGLSTVLHGSVVALWPVREGTIVTAMAVGPVMGLLGRFINPFLQRFCFGGAPAQGDASPAAPAAKAPGEDDAG